MKRWQRTIRIRTLAFALLVPIGMAHSQELINHHRSATSQFVSNELLQGIDKTREAIKRWDPAELQKAGDALRPAPEFGEKDASDHWRGLWQGTAYFHAMLAGQEERTVSETNELHDQAVATLEAALKRGEDANAEIHAMLAVLHGLAIQRSAYNVFVSGPKIMRHKRAAEKRGVENPRVWFLLGTSLLRRSEGDESLEEPLTALLKAEELFAKEQDAPAQPWEPRWGRGMNRLFIAEAYEQAGRLEAAASWFAKALETAPWLERAKEGYRRCEEKLPNASA